MPLTDHIACHPLTDVGRKRSHNEDSHLADEELCLYIVADGMGGHAAGEVASSLAVRSIHEQLLESRDLLENRAEYGPRSEVSVRQLLGVLERAVQNASARVHTEAQKDQKKRGMGTTVSLMVLLESYAYIAHVGDSRIYLEREGALHQVTVDHTVANELLRLGMVTPDKVDKVPQRNAITRAVGVYPHVEVDTLTLEVLPGDQFLLASDGLTGYLTDSEQLTSRLAVEDGKAAVESLIKLANESGGKDNITAVLVRIGRADTDDGTRARRLSLKKEVLAATPLFSRLSERELLSVMQLADIEDYDTDEVVMREGEPGDKLYIALSGKLTVASGQSVISELGPGEHVGEMSLIRTVPRSATITAVEPSELVSIRRADFFELIRDKPDIAVKLLWQFVGVLADRLEQTNRELSQAREELTAEDITAEVVSVGEDELEEDPFSGPATNQLGALQLSFNQKPGSSPAGTSEPDEDEDDDEDWDPNGETQKITVGHVKSTVPDRTAAKPSDINTKSTVPDRKQPRTATNDPLLATVVSPRHQTRQKKKANEKDTVPEGAGRNRGSTLNGGIVAANKATLPSASTRGDEGSGEDMAEDGGADYMDDAKATLPMGGRNKRDSQTDETDTMESLRNEIDELRKEFRERLRKSREAKKKDAK